MSSIDTYIEQDNFTLSFKNEALEKEFRQSYDKSVRIPLRIGIIISILSWFAAIFLIYHLIPEQFIPLSITTFIVIGVFFGLVVYITFNDRFAGNYHWIGALSNAWAGLYSIYFCRQFPTGANLALPVLIFIIFFGSYLIKLRWRAGFIAALTYTIAYHIYIALYTDLAYDQVVLYAFVAWLTLIFAILAGRVAEKNNRTAFIQGRTIKEQGIALRSEKEASEKLLENMLPQFIASELKTNPGIIATNHEDASVLFADLVGFTKLSSKLNANEVVEILNRIFSHFDMLTEKYGLEKIKTIGDGYMVAGGLTKNTTNHLERIALLGIDMIHYLEHDSEIKQMNLKARIGINVGEVIAGVIGINKFTYDLWGNTVNMASRMESHGSIGEISVTEMVKNRLQDRFHFEQRALIDIKGKGATQTYLLNPNK